MKTRISGSPILTLRNEKDLYVDGINALEMIKDKELPFFLYSENVIRKNCKDFMDNLKKNFKNFQVFYSYKSNPYDDICKIIHSCGIGAEIVSTIELEIALHLNIPIKDIEIGTPYLTDKLLEMVYSNNMSRLSCWSLSQLDKIKKFSKEKNINLDIFMRIKPNQYKKTIGIKHVKDEVLKIKETINSTKLNIIGLQSHLSTQMLDGKLHLENLQLILDVFNLYETNGINTIKEFNLGGGFPEATILKPDQLDRIFASLKDKLSESGHVDKKIIFEPGRFLVADAGIAFSKVIDVFEDFGEKWIRLNIGTNILPRSSKSNFKFFCVNKISQSNDGKINILGNLPSDMDFFIKNYLNVNDVVIGDIFMITNAGAYTKTWSTRFLYPDPEHYLLDSNKKTKKMKF